ncbi:alpha/beta hydrolase [uncultured Ferrovibrio sp.]|jgi:pimeloyl-ACP methyl ester carboxylesterase|uniref:alpha/beta fold hydrolase n=1 Tax=uncultured Ferrovibrio sp. TaxID=1576913 RepID=UPI00261743BB|nr:alpha/beta hydrolase [uncultured Ferrovibrio sp.]
MKPQSHYLTLGGRSVHLLEWGRADAPAVILWHGFARNAHDFDDFAQALAPHYRLIAPDTIGRGLSEWSPEPDSEYTVPFYARQAVELVEQWKLTQLRWVGTSMGGLIGMAVAAGPLKDRISHLVLNDVGPAIAPGAVERILQYAGTPPSFATLPELEQYFRTIYAPFGIASDAGWRKLAETSARRLPDGRLTPHYDPQIAAVMAKQAATVTGDAWPLYEQISAKTLLLRGAVSDLLSAETATQMTQRGPRARRIDIPGIGHAPALDTPEQIGIVAEFLSL